MFSTINDDMPRRRQPSSRGCTDIIHSKSYLRPLSSKVYNPNIFNENSSQTSLRWGEYRVVVMLVWWYRKLR